MGTIAKADSHRERSRARDQAPQISLAAWTTLETIRFKALGQSAVDRRPLWSCMADVAEARRDGVLRSR
jgi:hypothetical protein